MTDFDVHGVHATHCCVKHGCKYVDDGCPVAAGLVRAEYQQECCELDEVYASDECSNCDRLESELVRLTAELTRVTDELAMVREDAQHAAWERSERD